MTQIATFKNTASTNKIATHRKEKGFYAEYAVISGQKAIITARLYMAGITVYSCIWINATGTNLSGSGKAGGGGYHKASAALAYALADAGVVLSEPIDGRGDRAMTDALLAVAHGLGFNPLETHVHYAHA